MNPPLRGRPLQLCVAYVVVHTLLHVAALWFEVRPGIAVSIWYAPSGLALALLVLLGPRFWPLVFFTNFATAWITATARVPWTAVFFPGLLTASYGAAAWLVRRLVGARLLPGSARETWVFCATMLGAPLAPALIGTAAVALARSGAYPVTAAAFARSVFAWAIGDVSGLLTVVPAAMVFVGPWLRCERRDPVARGPGRLTGRLLRGAFLLGTLTLVFLVPELRERRAFYLCFLPLVWICVSDGLRGATLATLAIMIGGLVAMRLLGTTAGYSYIFLLFAVAVAGVGLGLGTVVARRNEVESRLAASNAELGRLRRLEFDEKMAARLAEEQARLEVLRYQLNPHFLYNALNSIYGLLFDDARAAGEMVLRLSEFCRATLTGPAAELPTLRNEAEALRKYLDVEKVRWGERLDVELDVAPEAADVRLPPFLLMPLVENAIKYGGATSPDVLHVGIRARRDGERLQVDVINSGRWMPEDARPLGSTGVGLQNLRHRLRRYYPESHAFATESRDGFVIARLVITGPARTGSAAPMAVAVAGTESSA